MIVLFTMSCLHYPLQMMFLCSSRRRHTRFSRDWSSDVCSSDLVINSYTTDGQLQIYDLRVLEDDKSYIPPYHALPLVREEILNEYPELAEILGLLEGAIDEETMQIMNGKVDNDGMMVERVAQEFLIESGLIEAK